MKADNAERMKPLGQSELLPGLRLLGERPLRPGFAKLRKQWELQQIFISANI